MIPIEAVVRRVTTGSFIKRDPEVDEGAVFKKPPKKTEFFLKDDGRHKPIIIIERKRQVESL